eukprot:CAMPEP_0197028496 /NCGR_PEP_ID=MMETSP1384-20130603/8163_1 /TAXON_ID=29189 /ORGANISM="Ammonia sp." /LENGTH=350 /DNA_ID=CAMNT_0042457507 /DNA_START=33 /DNA_END=1085 /DNA_ORIENTATION=-
MSRFFRRIQPLLRNLGTVSAPICVSFGAASSVPTSDDAPDFVQDVFSRFGDNYQLQSKRPAFAREPHPESVKLQETEEAEPEETEKEEAEQETVQQTTATDATATASSSGWKERAEFSSYLSRFIDHTVLKPTSTEQQIRKMCAEALRHDFFSICCNPCWVSLCKELLKGSRVKICCVVGFPLGGNTTIIKALEAQQAVEDGADEIDMVMNVGQAKSANWDFVYNDIEQVVKAVPERVHVKVILETCLLTDDEIVEACRCATRAGAKFVKTSTGFASGGATVDHVRLMRRTVDEESLRLGNEIGTVLVKASGGIRDTVKAKEMLRAGADRIGASSGIAIVGAGEKQEGQY